MKKKKKKEKKRKKNQKQRTQWNDINRSNNVAIICDVYSYIDYYHIYDQFR